MATTEIALRIDELDCAEEVVLLRDRLSGRQGIDDLRFDILNRRMVVSFDAAETSVEEIITQVAKIGMHASREDQPRPPAPAATLGNVRMLLTFGAALAIAAGFVMHVATAGNLLAPFAVELLDSEHTTPIASRLFYLVSICLGLWFVLPKAWLAIRQLRADMNLLMCVAVVGAICLGQWLEAAIVTFLFQVSLLLEHWSMDRARRAVSSLLSLTPPTARVFEADCDHAHERPVAEVKIGARIIVHPTEQIPLDGRVLAGESSVNQAPITGESLPVGKASGDEVFAGTINGAGTLDIEVTRQASDTTLARIIHLVQEAHAGRAPSEQWVERFARYYTPVMMGLALLIAIGPPLLAGASWSVWIYNALVLLVIACPCALVISTPVSVVSALTCAANHGVLIKGGRYLEAAADLRAIAIDKTGTLTRGEPVVHEVMPLNGHSRVELLERAAALESQSTHPIAQAILDCARQEGVQVPTADAYQNLSGRGAEGVVNGKPYWIGSHRMMLER
ncbi:MAG: heavy metal translocating P-type ATPase, partial [Planctomycetota bacterium]